MNRKKILDDAKATLSIEAEAIEGLLDQLDDQFIDVVELIFNTKGRLVITGIGKSAVIAMKLVASLNSTGTPAVFMHAADAIHGDLGMVQDNDLVLCISKSGNSPEIKDLIPHIKDRGNTLISMTAKKDGFLALNSDHVLFTYVKKEACPNNLAPTASTTAQLAMGDALTVCLLKLRNFNANDFAKHHPGGALGKKLYLTVGQMIKNNQRPLVQKNTPVEEVIDEITTKRLGTVVVLEGEKIAGIVTDGDIRRMLKKDLNIQGLVAKDIMSSSPILVNQNLKAVKALAILEENSINHLIVVNDQEKYSGVLHILDLIKEGISE